MKKILILTGRYLPGYKDGGPLRTIINVTDALGDEYDIRIACLDRDHGDEKPYEGIEYNSWNQVGKAKVWYVKKFKKGILLNLINQVDLVYICGFYNDYCYKTLFLNRVGKIDKPIFVASMGVFSKGALSHKSFKKKLFISSCKLLSLYRNVTWSVTSELEAKDLKENIGKDVMYIVAEDLPRSNVPGIGNRDLNEKTIVFLSRICPQKNLLGAIKAVSGLTEDVVFDIYGPQEDMDYWNQCEKELEKLPSNIKWSYCGNVATENVQATLQKYNIFLFPTLGENYGHVIFEALSVGCIPLISDQTPWELDGVGFVLPLSDNYNNFTNAIIIYFLSSTTQKRVYAEKAAQIAMNKVTLNKTNTGYRRIFD